MIAANSTRDLHKLSKAEQDQAKARNAGKHKQNAAGFALDLVGKRPRAKKLKKGTSIPSEPRALRPRAAHAPKRPTEAVWDPNLDPRLIGLDGYGPLPIGAATGLQVEHDNQHVVSLVGASPNLPIEVPATSYGNNLNTGSITYDQFAPTFVPSVSTYDTESMLGEQELSSCDDLIDWSGGESDGRMEWRT